MDCKLTDRHQLGNQAASYFLTVFHLSGLMWFVPALHIMEAAAGLAFVNVSRCKKPAQVYTDKETLALQSVSVSPYIS